MTKNRTAAVAAMAVVLMVGACGDRTVTSTPTSARQEGAVTTTTGLAKDSADASPQPSTAGDPKVKAADASVADPDLAEVDRILDQVQTDLGNADREAATPEGDPTS